ncbi:unnamed protein product [Ambrosiozyma monospora]|uniref:Mitochondrial inner membrane protease ATP23 n=1 Tax=Ambrosiozyma monospora TaxID=43982 RepID=A0A9W7DEC7_AMBMO|nr:unnamed protein product [Ambrosiozyma monospora]
MLQQIENLGGYVPRSQVKCHICDDVESVMLAQKKYQEELSQIKDPKQRLQTKPPLLKTGGYSTNQGIRICAEHVKDKLQLGDTLSHELIHWYDNTRFKVDFMNLKHHACTEIRASSLSGECAIMTEFSRRLGNNVSMRVAKGHQSCVKRRAVLSVMGHPACKSQEQAEQVVSEVFRSCFNDTRPFERIYR